MDKMTPEVMLRVNLRQPDDPCTWGIKQVVPIMEQYAAQQVSGGHTLVPTSKLSEMAKDRDVERERMQLIIDCLSEADGENNKEIEQVTLERDALKVEVEELRRRLSPEYRTT